MYVVSATLGSPCRIIRSLVSIHCNIKRIPKPHLFLLQTGGAMTPLCTLVTVITSSLATPAP